MTEDTYRTGQEIYIHDLDHRLNRRWYVAGIYTYRNDSVTTVHHWVFIAEYRNNRFHSYRNATLSMVRKFERENVSPLDDITSLSTILMFSRAFDEFIEKSQDRRKRGWL